MDKHIWGNIVRRELSARIDIEDSINQTYKSAIASSNIDGTIVDECYGAFGYEIAYLSMGFLKYFFELIENKNNSLINDLKQELNMITDRVLSQNDTADIEHFEALLHKMAQDIVERAGDRKIYGNMDYFISTNVQYHVNMMDKIKKSHFSVDTDGIGEVLANIRRLTQDFLDRLLAGNRERVETVINDYVEELLTIMKTELMTREQDSNMGIPTLVDQSVGQSPSVFFAEEDSLNQLTQPMM